MRDNMQLLVNALWQVEKTFALNFRTFSSWFQVPFERHDTSIIAKVNLNRFIVNVMMKFVSYLVTRTEDDRPSRKTSEFNDHHKDLRDIVLIQLPKAKPLTKWQQFAQKKGIVKRKKSKFVWDDAKKEWGRRYGFKKANDDSKPWLIEVPVNAGSFFFCLASKFFSSSSSSFFFQIQMKINLVNERPRKKNVSLKTNFNDWKTSLERIKSIVKTWKSFVFLHVELFFFFFAFSSKRRRHH